MNETVYFAEIVYPVYPDFGIPSSVKEDAIPKLVLAELSRCLPAHTLLYFVINSQTLELKLTFPITLSEKETSSNIATRIASDIQIFVENIRRIAPIGSISHFALKLIASEPLAETRNGIKENEPAFTIPDSIPAIGKYQLESVLQQMGCKKMGALFVAISRARILVESDAHPTGEISPDLARLVLESSDLEDFRTGLSHLSEKNPELKLKFPRQFGSTMFGQLKTALQNILRKMENKPQTTESVSVETNTELPPITSDELRNKLQQIDRRGFKGTMNALGNTNGIKKDGILDPKLVAAVISSETHREAAIPSVGETRFADLKTVLTEIVAEKRFRIHLG